MCLCSPPPAKWWASLPQGMSGSSGPQQTGGASCVRRELVLLPRPQAPASQPGDSLLQGESLLLNFVFPKRVSVPISMDSWAGEGPAGRGGMERVEVFQGRGTPAGSHIKQR